MIGNSHARSAKAALLSLVLLATAQQAVGQVDADERPSVAERLRFFRWAEEYSDVTEEERSKSFLALLKRIPLSGSTYPFLSVGGEYRLRFESSSNQFFGLVSPRSSDSFLQRALLHGDLNASDHVRVFVQGSFYGEHGSDLGPRPLDESEPDLHQVFVDLTPSFGQLRVGRQEFALGSGKMIGIREGPNQRLAFDAVRLSVPIMEEATIDAFYGREVEPNRTAFSDNSSDGSELWGLYASKLAHIGEQSFLDASYYGLKRDAAVFDQGIANEERHTLGLRLWGEGGTLEFDVEGFYQFGHFGAGDIDAYGGRLDVYHRFDEITWQPRPGLRASFASGDRDPQDAELNTYKVPFPDLHYVSEAGIYGPGNGLHLQPNLELHPAETVTLWTSAAILWRERNTDAVYSGPGFPLVGSGASASVYNGFFLNLEGQWDLSLRIALHFAYVHAYAGAGVSDAGGDDTDFFMLQLQTRF